MLPSPTAMQPGVARHRPCMLHPSPHPSTTGSGAAVPRRVRSTAAGAPLPPRRHNLATGAAATTTTTTATPLGTVTVRRITPADAGAAAVVVARAFAAAGSAPLGDVESFIARCLEGDESGGGGGGGNDDAPVGLVADLAAPADGSSSSSAPFPFPPGRTSVVCGFAAVAGPGRGAVDRAASDGGASPSSLPQGAAVLTNVAVDPRARRAGIGRALVAAAEAVARDAGATGLWLEPRPGEGGAAARALYAACGYEAAAEEAGEGGAAGGLGGLFGRLARAAQRTPELLVKRF